MTAIATRDRKVRASARRHGWRLHKHHGDYMFVEAEPSYPEIAAPAMTPIVLSLDNAETFLGWLDGRPA